MNNLPNWFLTVRFVQLQARQKKKKATNTYRQFYRQLALPAVIISNLQRREAPLSTCNHC
jgi:hypothetical protein